jgi:protein SCO1
MEGMTRRNVLGVLGSVPLLAGLAAAAAKAPKLIGGAGRPQWKPQTLTARQLVQQQHLPNVPLITHDGKQVRFYDDLVKDKKVIINFADTQLPQDCSAVTNNLNGLYALFANRMGKDMHMYSISLNPKDTPATLKAWVDQHNVGKGWTFLTGKPADVEKLRLALGMRFTDAFEDTNPAAIASLVRHGVEPEMKWAHQPSMAHPAQIAHKVVSDFGSDPNNPNPAPSWYCRQFS